ncbi:MAG: DUF4214 domain-containing protein [Actinomycetota bacterium]
MRVLAVLLALFSTLTASLSFSNTLATAAPPPLSITCDSTGAHTARLYRTLFGRLPDEGGLANGVRLRRRGYAGHQVAHVMMRSNEYRRIYSGVSDAAFVNIIYRNLFGRTADSSGHAHWLRVIQNHGRHRMVDWITASGDVAQRWPYRTSSACRTGARLGLVEVEPGLLAGRNGSTVTVVADRTLVDFNAVTGRPTHAWAVGGHVVANANWFTDGGTPIGPLVARGTLSGTRDNSTRGQIIRLRPGCNGAGHNQWAHVWMGQTYRPGRCVEAAVSGISIVHQGVRADAFPGINLTNGYTNKSKAHSFIGINGQEVVIITTTSMTTRQLADYAISIGVTEGLMLDGGGSTQIKTPAGSIHSDRAVTSFVVLNSRMA